MEAVSPADYVLDDAQAIALTDVVRAAGGRRAELLAKYAAAHGLDALVDLFAQFVGAANSVVANCREVSEILMISEGNIHPHTAEKINLPTMLGAMQGVPLANAVSPRATCEGCAYRLGTAANQCVPTATDVAYCAEERNPFMCHLRVDDAGAPTHICAGHAQAIRLAKLNDLPEA